MWVRAERDRRVVDDVTRLDVVDDTLDHVERDVLRQHGEATPPGDGLGHAASGNGGHVGDDNWDGRAKRVGGAEVDREA